MRWVEECPASLGSTCLPAAPPAFGGPCSQPPWQVPPTCKVHARIPVQKNVEVGVHLGSGGRREGGNLRGWQCLGGSAWVGRWMGPCTAIFSSSWLSASAAVSGRT